MVKLDFPVGFRSGTCEVVAAAAMPVCDLAVAAWLLSVDGIGTSLIQSYGIERGKNTNIRNDGGIVFGVAIAVRGNIHHQRNMEVRTVLNYGKCVFCHFAIQQSGFLCEIAMDGIFGANRYALTATDTAIVINAGFAA